MHFCAVRSPKSANLLKVSAIVTGKLLFFCLDVCLCSWHASCALAGNRLFIHGGYNGSFVLEDSFVFDLGELQLLLLLSELSQKDACCKVKVKVAHTRLLSAEFRS